jgi:hypothetical protein
MDMPLCPVELHLEVLLLVVDTLVAWPYLVVQLVVVGLPTCVFRIQEEVLLLEVVVVAVAARIVHCDMVVPRDRVCIVEADMVVVVIVVAVVDENEEVVAVVVDYMPEEDHDCDHHDCDHMRHWKDQAVLRLLLWIAWFGPALRRPTWNLLLSVWFRLFQGRHNFSSIRLVLPFVPLFVVIIIITMAILIRAMNIQ